MLTLQSPYLAGGFTWLRGNLHAHTTLTDGRSTPEEVIAEYERQGYDFLCLSDHDILVPPQDYQSITNMTLIPGEEVTANGNHILAINIESVIAPDPDRQNVIDDINAQGALTIPAHPNWLREFNHAPFELLERLTGYGGLEIYNGLIERHPGNPLATDKWDRLLSSGRRLWGFANDDEHMLSDAGRGWNVVQARDRSVPAIFEALREGRFYASTGVEIAEISVEGNRIFVTAPNAQRIRFVGAWAREFAYTDASQASYEVTGEEGGYVRVECFGEGIKAAWTQPFYFD